MKPGDRVRIIHGWNFLYKEGIIKVIHEGDVGVELFESDKEAHDLGGHCNDNYGWWFSLKQLSIATDINQDIQILKDKYPEYNIDVIFNKK